MTTRVRLLLSFLTALATIFLVNCGGSYSCQVSFGGSCTPSGSGISSTGGGGTGGSGGGGGGGGGGGSAPTAFAYAVDQKGTFDGYELNATAGTFGAISGYQAPTIPVTDPSVGVVVAQEQFVYAAFPTTGQIYGWSIDSTSGALTPVSGSPYTAAYLGFVGDSEYNQLDMITNPAGTLLFIGDAGNAEIWVYQIGSAGALTPVPGSPFSTGTFQPWNMTTDGQGKYLYATFAIGLHEGLSVAAYSIGTGSSAGTLAPVVGSPFSFPMWAVQGEPSGNYLIGITGKTIASGASADDKNLYVFSIEPSGANAGAISPVTNSPFATVYAPFNIAVQPDASNGEFVYSFGVNDSSTGYNPVEGYAINTTTGALAAITGSPFSGVTASLWGQFDQNGTYLFFYGDSSNSAQLGVIDAATGVGTLTEALSPAPLATPGYWAVTDPK